MEEFRNEPFTDFSVAENRGAFENALTKVAEDFGKRHTCWIAGDDIGGEADLVSRDPGDTDRIVGVYPKLGEDEAERAMQAALGAYPDWSARTAEERAGYLFEASRRMRERKHEFSALMVFEVGKTWAEADADTAEAIDFMEFYAREALRYAKGSDLTPLAGEKNEMRYIPLGVGVVIPPWNFPLAILAGMATAALVTGNTVIVKPSSDSPVIGGKFAELMREVGVPGGAFNYLTASGAVAGEYLVKHPKTRFVAFTGSKAVGLGIVSKAGATPEGQIWIKRVIAEMGGKDGIYVDGDADVDVAVQGTLASAFSYAGQKCSACSRVIVHEKIYDDFVAGLAQGAPKLNVGHPTDPDVFVGPVSSESAYNKILEYIEIGKGEGRLVAGGGKAPGNGYYIQPTVIADISPDARIAQEEIFGPVLAVIKAGSYEEGRTIFNGTIYGLTGAIYSNTRAHLDDAKQNFHVGNLYLNRKCTGALVGSQPFGGFNMSGTDSKAGSRDYLLLFLQGKTISEKV
ncbi:MAG: L-glutamate gamma-semialdehyde dehydrogenase [Planctomycetes bacterium]|nr:L-glutamate gamma-semialdehyde dehydrogenase [Planctomycetota bacterium]